MWDIFDQPWTLTGLAVLVLFGVLTYRSIFPERKSRWQWLLPLFVIVAAFGTDYLVQTDLEKIDAVINTGMKAVTNRNYQTIETIISENYSDSYHNSKESLMADCKRQLSQNSVEKIKKTDQLINISVPNAKATVFIIITFDKNSYVSQNFVSFLPVKADIYFQKQPHNEWLINRVEIRQINRQSTGWNQIR